MAGCSMLLLQLAGNLGRQSYGAVLVQNHAVNASALEASGVV